jgi:uncharacterized membrane protein YedE/YeeE
MKNLKFLVFGVLFGIILSKTEVVSWYRIYEMFKFQSFHMYGIIGSAVTIGIVLMQLFKKEIVKDFWGNKIRVPNKESNFVKNLVGGTIFGLGWALAGACPGPIFVLLGHGSLAIVVVLFGAILGAFIQGVLRNKLP